MKHEIFFYLAAKEHERVRFAEEVMSIIPENRRKVCSTLGELSEALRTSIAGQRICVVVVSDKRDLLNLFSVRNDLTDSRLILILPDDSENSIELGHMFYPRFSDTISSGFINTAAVLAKMSEND